MPIDNLSEIRRLPRLGIIRLGEKAESANGKAYPKKLEYFNLKDAPGVAAVFGEKPKTIEIMLPHEDAEVFFPQWRKAYGKSTGLFCKGDGKNASRIRFGVSDGKPRFDGDTNAMPAGQAFDPDGEKFLKENGIKVAVGHRYDLPCLGAECPFTKKKVCKPLAQFMFLMPRVPGVGVYQISTGSFNSMVDLNSYIEIVRGIAGRVSMIPLRLSLVPKKVNVDGKAIGIFHLKLEYAGLMTDLLKYRDAKYLSADLLPQIEHETPEDLVPHKGEDLDKQLSGQDVIPGPEDSPAREAEIITKGQESFTIKGAFLFGTKDKVELRSPTANYRIEPAVAKTAKANFKDGDTAVVSWEIRENVKWVVDLNRTAADPSAF